MHNHCERFELLDEHFLGVDDRLDFLAFSNHAQKPIFFRQHEMIARGRELLPGIPVLFGMEWNAPEGRHAGVVFPSVASRGRSRLCLLQSPRPARGRQRSVGGGLDGATQQHERGRSARATTRRPTTGRQPSSTAIYAPTAVQRYAASKPCTATRAWPKRWRSGTWQPTRDAPQGDWPTVCMNGAGRFPCSPTQTSTCTSRRLSTTSQWVSSTTVWSEFPRETTALAPSWPACGQAVRAPRRGSG